MEVERALRVLDGAALVVCASGGVQSQTVTVFRQMKRYDVPFVVFINKLDRVFANPEKAVSQMRGKLGLNCAFIQLPIGLEKDFSGIIDVIENDAMYFDGSNGENIRREPIPADLQSWRDEKFEELVGCLADVDEEIEECFLMEETPSKDQLYGAIRRTVIKRKFQPVLVGSALKNKGVQALVNIICCRL